MVDPPQTFRYSPAPGCHRPSCPPPSCGVPRPSYLPWGCGALPLLFGAAWGLCVGTMGGGKVGSAVMCHNRQMDRMPGTCAAVRHGWRNPPPEVASQPATCRFARPAIPCALRALYHMTKPDRVPCMGLVGTGWGDTNCARVTLRGDLLRGVLSVKTIHTLCVNWFPPMVAKQGICEPF